jgi:hypothetical protein
MLPSHTPAFEDIAANCRPTSMRDGDAIAAAAAAAAATRNGGCAGPGSHTWRSDARAGRAPPDAGRTAVAIVGCVVAATSEVLTCLPEQVQAWHQALKLQNFHAKMQRGPSAAISCHRSPATSYFRHVARWLTQRCRGRRGRRIGCAERCRRGTRMHALTAVRLPHHQNHSAPCTRAHIGARRRFPDRR